MLNYFTTWNLAFVTCPYLRKEHSSALLTLSAAISGAGLVMLAANFKTNRWKWKHIKNLRPLSYITFEAAIHQGPLLIMLREVPKGNPYHAIVPVAAYAMVAKNPYTVFGRKMKNIDGLPIIIFYASLVSIGLRKRSF